MGPGPAYPDCDVCLGNAKILIHVEHRPLSACLRCQGSGSLGPGTAYPVCPKCNGAGCQAFLGTFTILQITELGKPRPVAIQVEKLLLDLPMQVPDVAEREFLDEALRCYKAAAFRAAIVMTWNLTYDHLLNYILKHKLTEFNTQWPVSYPKLHGKARVPAITNKDEFSELKESELLMVCRSAAIISPDAHRILDEKLAKRNSAAHPSSVKIGQLQAENFIDEIVKNIVMKLIV